MDLIIASFFRRRSAFLERLDLLLPLLFALLLGVTGTDPSGGDVNIMDPDMSIFLAAVLLPGVLGELCSEEDSDKVPTVNSWLVSFCMGEGMPGEDAMY